jgi:hypothetical protein
MSRIFNSEQLSRDNSILEMDKLFDLDSDKLKQHDLVEVSMKCQKTMEAPEISARAFEKMHTNFRAAIMATLVHLKKQLPRNNEFLMTVKGINPRLIGQDGDVNKERIVRLTKIVARTFRSTDTVRRVFELPSTADKSDLVDAIARQYDLLKIELGSTADGSAQNFWVSVGDLKNDAGVQKFRQISRLACVCLTVDHGNATPERGFSINGYIMKDERSSLGESTLVALRHVYDFINRFENLTDLNIDKELIDSVRLSHSRYQIHMDDKKKQVERKMLEKEKLKAKAIRDAEKETKKRIKDEIVTEEAKLELFDSMMKAGVEKLKKLETNTTSRSFKKDFVKANTEMKLAVKQKEESIERLKMLKQQLVNEK